MRMHKTGAPGHTERSGARLRRAGQDGSRTSRQGRVRDCAERGGADMSKKHSSNKQTNTGNETGRPGTTDNGTDCGTNCN